MIKSANLENVYFITHCSSGHVMEIAKQQKVELHHKKDKTSQQFKLKIVSGASQ
jgi:general stress protein 26